MKRFLLIFFILGLMIPVFAQSRYSFIDFNKAKQPAIVNDYIFSDNTVTKAIDGKMEKMGYKGKESKGFMVYRGVMIAELGPGPYDLYIKVDRKSRKEKDASSLTMMLSKGNEVFVSDIDDPVLMGNAKAWINKMDSTIIAYDLEMQIKSQEDLVKSAEKKYRTLVDDGDDLVKKKKRLEEQISENTKDQQQQRNEIEKQKQLYDALKGKRK